MIGSAGSWAITSAYAGGVQLRGVRKCHLWTVPQDIRQFSWIFCMWWVFVGDSRSGKWCIFRFIHCSYLSGVGSLRRAAFENLDLGIGWLFVQKSSILTTTPPYSQTRRFSSEFLFLHSLSTQFFFKSSAVRLHFYRVFFQRLFHTFLFQQGGHPFSLTNPPRRQKRRKMHLHVRLLSGRTASVDLTADAYVYELRRTAERELGVGIASLSRSDVGDLS